MVASRNDKFCDIQVAALCKGAERYVFLYRESQWEALIKILFDYSHRPDLSFTAQDFVAIAKQIEKKHFPAT